MLDIEVPATRPFPDEFYDRVATGYRLAARLTDSPTRYLADRWDTPPVTVRRWLTEARKRGKLPPGRKGKAL